MNICFLLKVVVIIYITSVNVSYCSTFSRLGLECLKLSMLSSQEKSLNALRILKSRNNKHYNLQLKIVLGSIVCCSLWHQRFTVLQTSYMCCLDTFFPYQSFLSKSEWIYCSIVSGDDIANAGHIPQASGDYVPQKCWNFSLGDWRQHEFYSPHFPDVYPNNTECIQLLKGKVGPPDVWHTQVLVDLRQRNG